MRRHVRLIGGALVAVILVVIGLVVLEGASWSTVAYLAAGSIVAAGLLTASLPSRLEKYRGVTRAGLVLLLLTFCIRACTASQGSRVAMTTPTGTSARWLARAVDEGDMAIAGARLLFATNRLRDPDSRAVPQALRKAYQRMRAAEGDTPSPVLPTYLNLQSPSDSDVIVVDGVNAPRGALIFLHGFGGSFTLPCWQLAQAAREAGIVTYCPSVGWRGDWWAEHGKRTLEQTLALVQKRGIDRVYLAGLSNGAVGAARLAPRMRSVFRGLILISGAPRSADAPGMPVLVLQGRRDQMASADGARAYAARFDGNYVEFDAGHFAMLLREEQAMHAIAAWLKKH